MAQKYRKKPMVIEAVQWTGHNFPEITTFAGGNVRTVMSEPVLRVYCSEEDSWQPVAIGHWVMKGIRGEFYPCSNDVFQASYDLEEDEFGNQMPKVI